MADKFNKFIETGGKSIDEIRDEIRRMLNSNPAKAEKIPPRREIPPAPNPPAPPDDSTTKSIRAKIRTVVEEAQQTAQSAPRPEKRHAPDRVNISYLTGKPVVPQTVSADELAYPAESPDPANRPEDAEIDEKIRQMRGINKVFYNGYMLTRCAEESMVKQGLFMADVTDDYGRVAFCATPRPIYAALSNAQLRTYFTWRTDVRRGVYNDVDKPYVQLYCYELLNIIGCISAADAFSRLLDLWENMREKAAWLDNAMPRWLKDFYAFNDISAQYPDISACLKRSGEECDVTAARMFDRNYDDCLARLAEYSAYNIRGSRFMTDDTEKLMNGALSAVLSALDGYFTEKGISLFEILCGKLKKDFSWLPFSGAYVDLDRMGGFHTVRINALERYCFKRGERVLERLEPAPCRGFIGFVLKSTESDLRRAAGFRHSLVPNITMALNDFRNRDKLTEAVSDPEFIRVISNAASEWCEKNGIRPAPSKKDTKQGTTDLSDDIHGKAPAPVKPIRIDIDISRLADIREKSDELAKKLIIEEEEEVPIVRAEEAALSIAEDDFSERVSACAALSGDFGEISDEWRGFAERLSPADISLLSALTNGTAAQFCRSIGEMPETLFERINTAALDTVADIVIENGEIIPDYEEDIRKIIACAEKRFL